MPALSGIPMDPRVAGTVLRYISYGWKNSIIVSLVRFRFNAPISSRCIDNLRAMRPCTSTCAQSCRLTEAERWYVPSFDELRFRKGR